MTDSPTKHDDWLINRVKKSNQPKERQYQCFFNKHLELIPITNLYQDQICVLVCGGPSADKNILKQVKDLPGVVTCGINNVIDAIRTDLWIGVDEPTRFLKKIWLDPTIKKFYPLSYSHSNILQGLDIKPIDCSNMVFIYRNNKFEADKWCEQDTINWGDPGGNGKQAGHSTMVAAMKLIYTLGFRTVYLVGADFKMTPDNAYGHGQKIVSSLHASRNNNLYRFMNKYFSKLKPYFDAKKFKVINLNPESGLTCFPTQDFLKAKKEIEDIWKLRIGDESSYGKYDKHYTEKRKTKKVEDKKVERSRLYLSICSPNIGDDIQTLANVAKHEGTLDLKFEDLNFIDRDYPKKLTGNYKLDINCWYSLNENANGFPANIEQTISSIHLKWNSLPQQIKLWLKNHEPVGCRDRYTQWLCETNNIKAHYTACPTLSLRKSHLPKNSNLSIDLLVVDAKIEIDAVRETHSLTNDWKSLGVVERMEIARNKLMIYANCKAIITSRIHCAFPAYGLGIPTYFIPDGRDTSRFVEYGALIHFQNQKFLDITGYKEEQLRG